MTTRPSHAALVEEVAIFITTMRNDEWAKVPPRYQELRRNTARKLCAFFLSRLSDVTPEMVEAVAKAMAADEGWGWDNPETLREWWINQARASISAFLAASPLTPGDGNKE